MKSCVNDLQRLHLRKEYIAVIEEISGNNLNIFESEVSMPKEIVLGVSANENAGVVKLLVRAIVSPATRRRWLICKNRCPESSNSC